MIIVLKLRIGDLNIVVFGIAFNLMVVLQLNMVGFLKGNRYKEDL